MTAYESTSSDSVYEELLGSNPTSAVRHRRVNVRFSFQGPSPPGSGEKRLSPARHRASSSGG